jgi:hypothetical protein
MANYIYQNTELPYSVIDQRANFGHIELDILLSLLEAVQRELRIENRNLSGIKLLVCNVSI